jgi:hypothetical protein
MRKSDLLNALAAKRDYRSYLEIGTPFTGNEFGRVTSPTLSIRHRLAYWCGHDVDKQAATFRRDDLVLDAREFAAGSAKYDLIFVDSFHTYECSMRDLLLARALLTDRGTIVVHDCNPHDEDLASPTYRPGSWCGATYAAFIDFMLNSSDLVHCTIDEDVGLGVIRRGSQRPYDEDLKQIWEHFRANDALRFKVFAALKHRLLNLERDEGLDVPHLARARS